YKPQAGGALRPVGLQIESANSCRVSEFEHEAPASSRRRVKGLAICAVLERVGECKEQNGKTKAYGQAKQTRNPIDPNGHVRPMRRMSAWRWNEQCRSESKGNHAQY